MNVLFYENQLNRSFVAPELIWKSIIRSVHWTDLHPGLDACAKSIQRYWSWPRMLDMIETYVKSCIPCQLHKVGDNRPIRKKMTPRRGRVFGIVCSDIFGPIKISRGYEYVILFIDMVSKYIELVP